MSQQLHFAEHTLQEVSLAIMGLVYVIRLIWLFRWKGGKERQPPTGDPNKTPRKGFLYSWAIIGMPWAMESTRTKLFLYAQFFIFHVGGVIFAIGLSFIIPYAPQLLTHSWAVLTLQVGIGAACLVGLMRIIRRVGSPYMRAISSPDDYFSITLLTVWFFFAFWAVPNDISQGETLMLIYFWMTAFFLIYVPFSKISHYLYYPFTRYWFGKSMGRRGVYPMLRSASPDN